MAATNEDTMQNAMRRKAEKNLYAAGSKHSKASFTAFLDSRISSNLGSIGVSMGQHPVDISVSANVLRHMERDRLTVVPEVFTGLETIVLGKDEADDILDGQLLSPLVGNISEVDLEQSGLRSLYDLKAYGRCSRSSAEKKSRLNSKSIKSKIVSR
jgi:hypothetical protein